MNLIEKGNCEKRDNQEVDIERKSENLKKNLFKKKMRTGSLWSL